jgi:hypothetical protein
MNAGLATGQSALVYTRVDLYYTNGANSVASADQREWDRVFQEIKRLAFLNDNWDGDGCKAPQLPIVDAALSLVPSLKKANWPLPATALATPAGTILFTWREGSFYAELEVMSPTRIEWMTKEADNPAEHGAFSLPSRQIGANYYM